MLSVFKTIFFLIISPFRTLYNWLFRRRLQKLYEPSTPPDSANNVQPNSNNASHHIVDFDQSWSNNDWGMENEAMNNVSQTELYRNQLIRQRSESKSEPAPVETEVNFFADMEPQSVRQAKVFVGSNPYPDNRSRLSVSNDEAYQPIPETGLKDWNEGQEGDAGWDAEEEDVSNILREHRKMRKYNLSQ